jgi:ketosteroid isomerase-like protein
MTEHPDDDSPNVAVVREYFRRADARATDLLDLLDDDVEFYFPKFGIGRGKQDYVRFAITLAKQMTVFHNQETLRFHECGQAVVVEGETFGHDADGVEWRGGETPGGRFCSVYEIRDGRIARSYIYADPDYASRNEPGFLWGQDRRW